MAKISIDQAKIELAKVEKAIKGLNEMGIEVPQQLQDSLAQFTKIINSNASGNVANTLNEKLAAAINSEKNQPLVELLASQIGTSVKIAIKVNVAEDGKKTISFEAASSGGGAKGGVSTGGGTKAATAYNNYEVTVKGDLPDYKEKQGTFASASGAVAFILNGGKNPLGLGAEYGKGNSMVRVLDGISKNEAFAANFEVKASKVEKVKEEPKAEATEAPAQA
jgi:hypothetical protein